MTVLIVWGDASVLLFIVKGFELLKARRGLFTHKVWIDLWYTFIHTVSKPVIFLSGSQGCRSLYRLLLGERGVHPGQSCVTLLFSQIFTSDLSISSVTLSHNFKAWIIRFFCSLHKKNNRQNNSVLFLNSSIGVFGASFYLEHLKSEGIAQSRSLRNVYFSFPPIQTQSFLKE